MPCLRFYSPSAVLVRISTCLMVILLCFYMAPSGFAQTSTGIIEGVVTDPHGKVVPGATVVVRHVATNLTREASSNELGFYRFDALPVGVYELRVEASGFQKKVLTRVEVLVGQVTHLDVNLEVGALEQEVIVDASAPLINVSTPTIGEVVENRRLLEMPLNGRNFLQLGLLTAGSAPPAEGGLAETYGTASAGVGFSIAGGRDSWNNFTLDGIPIVDPQIRTVTMQPSLDTIQEFQIVHTTYTSDIGGPPGAAVNLATKAGTNEWHGTVYEFFRNDVFDARNFFDPSEKSPYRQNQFGGSLGGPIKRDKSFLFFNYEGLRIRQGQTSRTLLPTEAIRNGDLSGVNPGTGQPFPTVIDPSTGQPFPGNRIPPNRIHPIASAILARTPLPNLANVAPGENNHVNVDSRRDDTDQFTIRVDHQINEKNRLFGRYILYDSEQFVPFTRNTIAFNPQAPPGFGSNYDDFSQNVGIGLTTVLRPTLTSDFRIGFNRIESTRNQVNADLGFLDSLGISRIAPTLNRGIPNMSIPGFASLGDPDILPIFRTDNTLYLSEGISWTRGKHTIQFGSEYSLSYFLLGTNIFSQGLFTFSDGIGSATGSAWSDFLLGRPFLGLIGTGIDRSRQKSNYLGLYFNDAFRVTPRLTISFGLRYDLSQPPRARDGRAQAFNRVTGNFVVIPQNGQLPPEVNSPVNQFYNAAFGTTFVTPNQDGLPSNLTRIDWKNWAPRVGFAFDISGNGKTVLRAAYGIYTGIRELYTTGGQIAAAPPFYSIATLLDLARFGVPVPPATFEEGFLGGNLAPGGDSPNPDSFDGYVQKYTLDIQQQLGEDFVVQLIYSGSIAIHINHFSQQANQGLPNLPGQRRGFRPHSTAGLLLVEEDDITSTYHSGTLRVAKRLSGGLSFNSFYTWSKSIDTGSTLAETSGSPTFAADSYNQAAEKALSSFDVRHRFVTNFIWELPLGTGKRFVSSGAWGRILENWQIAGILTFQSGQPLTPQLSGSLDGTLSSAERPDRICDGNLPSSQRTPERWFDTSCFTFPPIFFDALGPYSIPGNSGRNVLIGPGVKTFDFSVEKQIPITERNKLAFRWEIFNLTNHPNFRLPGRLTGTPNFGRVTSAKDPRLMQFSLRYTF